VLLLDDPLSAVDSRVGALIFYSAIQDIAMKRGACVVLGRCMLTLTIHGFQNFVTN
jgi:ABC-type Mn2+/Zn2+ transport system ATPase subunit